VRRAVTTSPPPPGAPWDLPLAEAPLAFVDLEMTGLDPVKDRVVEVCVERVRGGVIESRLCTLVRPENIAKDGVLAISSADAPDAEKDPVGNAHVHGIFAEALRDAPTFVELADQVAALFDGAILVAHRADSDVAALRVVWEKCVEVLEPQTPRDVWEVRIAERKARERILAECTEAIVAGAPVTVIYRPRGRPQEPMKMVLQEIVAGLDPPRVIGYQLPGRGRRELRADRILRIEIDATTRKVEP